MSGFEGGRPVILRDCGSRRIRDGRKVQPYEGSRMRQVAGSAHAATAAPTPARAVLISVVANVSRSSVCASLRRPAFRLTAAPASVASPPSSGDGGGALTATLDAQQVSVVSRWRTSAAAAMLSTAGSSLDQAAPTGVARGRRLRRGVALERLIGLVAYCGADGDRERDELFHRSGLRQSACRIPDGSI